MNFFSQVIKSYEPQRDYYLKDLITHQPRSIYCKYSNISAISSLIDPHTHRIIMICTLGINLIYWFRFSKFVDKSPEVLGSEAS